VSPPAVRIPIRFINQFCSGGDGAPSAVAKRGDSQRQRTCNFGQQANLIFDP
jgi:hypothetical protein